MRFSYPGVFVALTMITPPAVFAAEPSSGTLSPTSPPLSYTYGPNFVSNPSNQAEAPGVCGDPSPPCDHFILTVDIPPDFALTHPDAKVEVRVGWEGIFDDYDVYVLDPEDRIVGQAAGSANPEVALFAAGCGLGRLLRVRVIPFSVTGTTANGTITLIPGNAVPLPPGPVECPTGQLPPPPPPVPPPSPGEPRYLQQPSPAGIGDDTSGEMNVGFNPATGRFMLLHALQTMRLTYAEDLEDPVEPPMKLPESCPGLWEDVSFPPTTASTFDPILSTDEQTGRTFVSQLSGSPTGDSVYAFTDDDGDNWIQGTASNTGFLDHQSMVSGPYVAGQGPSPAALGYPNVVNYCSQSGVGHIGCTRSDDGGLTFGPPVIAAVGTSVCPGGATFIHGHIRYAPDGTIYVPVNNCSGKQAIMTSNDSGMSYAMRLNQNSTPPNGLMHSAIAPSKDGSTLYHCYVNTNGEVRVSVSRDNAATWPVDVNVSTPVGLPQGVFVAAVAGDADRAACGFLGTTAPGNYGAMDFPGIWYGYIATTYDGGNTWRTVIATPGNPVQGVGGICTAGLNCTSSAHRNLLDFNEMVMDERGYPVYAYDDGCLGLCDVNPVNAVSYAAKAAITRQIGGRGLLSEFDAAEPSRPHPACLSGSRTASAGTLTWSLPDHGGQAITGHKIFRGTALGGLTEIAAIGKATSFADYTADPATAYYYKVAAINGTGEALKSNAVFLEPSNLLPETPCVLPGVTVMRDATGDAQNRQDAYDIERVLAAEPADLPGKVAVLIKVKSLSVIPPNTFWAVRFKAPTPPANGDTHYFVGLSTQGGMNRFVHGTSTVESAVAASVTTFTVADDIDPASSVDADGTITLIADKALFGGLAAGQFLSDMTATTRPITNSEGPIAGGSQDDISGGGYQIVGEEFCINSPPTAVLHADPTSGPAPLTVNFDASSSSDLDDTIVSYAFDFGDGKVTQSTPTVQHIYQAAGEYPATLTVTDSRFVVSDPAELIIRVTGPDVNLRPVAKAGSDFSINEGESRSLDGSNSFDPEGGAVTYAWRQTAGPDGQLKNPTMVKPSFTAPQVEADSVLTFELKVKDPAGIESTADFIDVKVLNIVPPPAPPQGNNRIGGGLSSLTLLVLGLLGLLRGRRRFLTA